MGEIPEGKIRSGEPVGRVRRLTYKDLESVVQIANESFPRPWKPDEFLFFLEHASGSCWGVETDAGVLQCYFLSLKAIDELDIVSVATRVEARRQGIAEKLLKHILYCGECHSAFLEVGVTNAPAQKLYEKMGFKLMGTRKKYYDGREDALVMKWES